jgi:hypothetical protein
MKKYSKRLCHGHAQMKLRDLFVGQKMLVQTKIKSPGEIVHCEFEDCQLMAAVRVIIFQQNQPLKE